MQNNNIKIDTNDIYITTLSYTKKTIQSLEQPLPPSILCDKNTLICSIYSYLKKHKYVNIYVISILKPFNEIDEYSIKILHHKVKKVNHDLNINY